MIVLPIGCHLHDLDQTGSTNDDAKKLAQSGCSSGTIVRAYIQSAGRGRQGNTWVSQGGNLMMSIVLRPQVDAHRAGQLSFLAAVSLAQSLEKLLPKGFNLSLKWPNDVLVNERKIAGILLETELDKNNQPLWVVVGIGINIVDAPEIGLSLSDCGVDTHRDHVLEIFIKEFMHEYTQWCDNGFNHVREKWMERAQGLNQNIRVRLAHETFMGKFLDIDTSGALRVELSDGVTRTITSAEVFTG